MPTMPLRILILEDVPMDAELVEYELEPGPHALRRPGGWTPVTRSCAQLEEFRPDLILSDYTLPRFDGMAALSARPGARARHPLPHRHRLGERGDRRRLHEGGRHGLPAQEQPGPDRTGHRGRPGPGAVPRPRSRAPRKRCSGRRPISGRSSTTASRASCWWTATAGSRPSTAPPRSGERRSCGRRRARRASGSRSSFPTRREALPRRPGR